MKLALIVSDSHVARAAGDALRAKYDFVPVREADVVVALGGDGHLLHCLHEAMTLKAPKPMFGMNRGTVGFLMNDFKATKLEDRVAAAKPFVLHPLQMTATTTAGETVTHPAINEVSLLRETRQTAKIGIIIDGKTRMEELICDGVLVATREGKQRIAGFRVEAVDATGAGDTFAGAFLARRAQGESLDQAAHYANAAAALSTQGYGAVAPIPREDAVMAFLAAR
jgi:hypothetical protein